MVNLLSSKLIQVEKERDFLFLNFIFTVVIVLVSIVIVSIMLYGSETPQTWRVGLVIILLLGIMLYRSLLTVSFGSKLKELNSKLQSNKTVISFIIVFIGDILLILYAIFYYQIKASTPAFILDSIVGLIIIFAVISLVFAGLENIIYSFSIGALALSLFVNPAEIHHTMGEFILLYSVGSSLLISSFYLLPGLFLGVRFNKYLRTRDHNIQLKKLLILSFIPLIIIFFVHLGLYYYVFTNWTSF